MIYECDCGKKIGISEILKTSKIYFGCDDCKAQFQIKRKPLLEVFVTQHRTIVSHENRMASNPEILSKEQSLFLERQYNEEGNLSVTVLAIDDGETFKEILRLGEIAIN